jgi:protein-S-isoprenylcysteine O-methyltransferase
MIHSLPGAQHVFAVLTTTWAVSEIWLGLRKRSADASRSRDHGTLRLLLITIYACIFIAIWLAYAGWWRFPAPIAMPLLWLGLAMMAFGLVFRWWSIRVLAQYFTVDVNVRDDHELIRKGPYRWLRHPSYTGALMTFYGFALALGNVASLLVLLAPVTLAFLWRMRIEERVLAEAFPVAYPQYIRETKRLIPFLW